ncbi:MAG: hypothetical protein WCV83_03260 [Candidatus Magasanikbacteria bacterium]|jgi:hypothetical protein
MNDYKIIHVIILILFIATSLFLVVPTSAFVMSSTNYRVQFDSVNSGGALGTSTNYKIEDTLGEVASGTVSSTSYNLYAGYQQMDQETILSLTIPTSITLLPNIGGLTGGIAYGISTTSVLTNNNAGYTLSIQASTSPAMKSINDEISDYVTLLAFTPDYLWSVAPTTSGFGFTPEGIDIKDKYRDVGGVCGGDGGSDNPNTCWDYFTTAPKDISTSQIPNDPILTETLIRLQVESGNQNSLNSGIYTANITVTAVVN